jgi:small basic protein
VRVQRGIAFLGLGVVLIASSGWAINSPMPDWMQRFHIGGNAAVRTMIGQSRAQLERHGGLMVYQAGLTFDVDIADKLSIWYDTNLIREGSASDPSFGTQEVYVRWDSIAHQDWLNAKIGRTFAPFGEEYLRWHAIDNPLGSWSTSLPWALDEGVVLFGDVLPKGLLSYAAAVQNGNSSFNFSGGPHKAFAGRLSSDPLAWLHTSFSYLNIGAQDGSHDGGSPEFWLSGDRLTPVNPGTGAGQSNVIGAQGVEGDVIVTPGELGHLWLSYGYLHTMDGAGADFNRNLRYYTAELIGNLPRTEKKAYLVARYSIVGTMSPTQGYNFDGTEWTPVYTSNLTPFSQRDLHRTSLGAGYRLNPNALVKLEYSWEDTRLIESAKTPANLALLGKRDFFVAELAVKF